MKRFLLALVLSVVVGALVALGMFPLLHDSTGFLADNRAAVVGGICGLVSVLVVQHFAARSQVLGVPRMAKSTSPGPMTPLTPNRWVKIGALAILAVFVADAVLGALLFTSHFFAENVHQRMMFKGAFFFLLGALGFTGLLRLFLRWGLVGREVGSRPSTPAAL